MNKFVVLLSITIVFSKTVPTFAQINSKIHPQSIISNEEALHYCSNHLYQSVEAVAPLIPNESTEERNACPASFQQWSTFNSFALIEELKKYTDFECFRSLFDFDASTGASLFSSFNLEIACTELQTLSQTYNGEDEGQIYGILNYLHAFTYHEYYQPSIQFKPLEKEIINSSVLKYLNNANVHKETLGALKNLGKAYVLCDEDGMRHHVDVRNAFKKSLKAITVDKTWKNFNNSTLTYYNYLIMYSINYAVFRGIANNDNLFIDAIDTDSEFIPLFASLVKTIELDNVNYLNDGPKLAMPEVLRMCMVNKLSDNIEVELASIASIRPKYSSYWYRSVVALNKKGACTKYNLCYDLNDLKQEVLDILFPNNFVYEDGKIEVITPLPENEIQKLYYASLQVQAQFFRLIQSDIPLQDDTSEKLKIIIYGSKSAYDEWQYELFGLNTNNGGIYIERNATFYSYERSPQESIYSLEELFRHEYTHYLIGRYVDPFYWGETAFYTNEQLTWFNEGMAEYLAGSTRTEKVKTRTSLANQLKNDANKMNPTSIVNSKYNQGFDFYRYSFAFIKYLIDKEPIKFNALINSIKTYSINQYNLTINEILSDPNINNKFQTFLSELYSNAQDWWTPNTANIDINQLLYKTLDEINGYVSNHGWSNTQANQSANFSLERFKLTIDKVSASCEMDQCLNDLGNQESENNFNYAVGYEVNVNNTIKYIITGPMYSNFNATNESNNLENELTVYPNPALDIIDCKWLGNFNDLEIVNIFGQRIFRQDIKGKDSININVSDYSPGTYFIKINNHQNIVQTKLLIN